MPNLLKRIKQAWDLRDAQVLDVRDAKSIAEIDERIKKAGVVTHLNFGEGVVINVVQTEGDGKAEFLPDMSEEEVLEYERSERLGWKNLKLPWQK